MQLAKVYKYDPEPPRWPEASDRTIVLGRTGSGKSQFSIDLLSSRDFNIRPWYIIDYKGDDLLISIRKLFKKYIKDIYPEDKPPVKPGLYYMKPIPKQDDDHVERWLWDVWRNASERGKGAGLFIDEGYQLPQKDGFDAILTQGRSLGIPVIALYQRPAWMSRFAVAQASFIAVFDQNDERDCKTVNQFIRPSVLPDGKLVTVYDDLPPYYCLWYDVGRAKTSILSPAASRNEIIAKFRQRLIGDTSEVSERNYLYG